MFITKSYEELRRVDINAYAVLKLSAISENP